jgi:hypothetical protein
MKKLLQTLLLLTSILALLSGCKKENDHDVSPPSSWVDPGEMSISVSGRVLDENGNSVGNADIAIGNQITSTDQYGTFIIKNVSVNSRCIATIAKTGYFNRTHAFIAKANTVNYIRVILISDEETHTLSATAGGTVSLPDGSSIQFAAGSFVNAVTGAPYLSTVHLCVKHLSPVAAGFGLMIPGNDLLGKSTTGANVMLYSYGMLGVELKDNSGQQLQLANNTTATITMPIALSQVSTAPFSIPLWYFDETTSFWKEQGSASRVGNNYVGTVTHFTWWNCDCLQDRATIIGKVLDCYGAPIPNVVVTFNGIYSLITNQDGLYTGIVPAGMLITVQVLASNNSSLSANSQLITIASLSTNQTYYVADLIVACPAYITGTMKKCNGEGIDGMIVATWNGGIAYQYSSNGSFHLGCAPNASINLIVTYYDSTGIASFYTQAQSQAMGSTVDIGEVHLCNQQPVTVLNDLTISGGHIGNFSATINTDSTFVRPDQGGLGYDIYIHGYTPNSIVNYYEIFTSGRALANYAWGSLYNGAWLSVTTAGVTYDITPSAGNTQLTYSGPVGDWVIGTWSGTGISHDSNGDTDSVNISGHFNVIRQY